MKKIRLYAFPFAGGTATAYNSWKKYINESIEFCQVELSGRGRRIGTPFYKDIKEASDDVFDIIKSDIETSEYAFFGHSMGCLIAYELCLKIESLGLKRPKHVFLSGKKPPNIAKQSDEDIHMLPECEFIEEVKKFGGLPKEILEFKPLLDLFLPVIRADLKIVETYNCFDFNKKIHSDITLLRGDKDNITEEDMLRWSESTFGKCRLINFSGGHFFIYEHENNVANIINQTLLNYYE